MTKITVEVTKNLLDVLENVDLYEMAELIGWEDEDEKFDDFVKFRDDVFVALGQYDHPWEKVALILNNRGYEGKFLPDYSGRCMFGQTCPAIVSDAPMSELFEAAKKVGATFPDRSDSMGLSTVYY